MKKKIIKIAITIILGSASFSTQASLVAGTTLAFDAGTTCPIDTSCIVPGIYGSNFGLDNNGNGILEDSEKKLMAPGFDGGIILGEVQQSGITFPVPTGAGIDEPWAFFSSVGWHETSSPVTVANEMGAIKELDFSGWNIMTDFGTSFMLGGDSALGDTGLATITCETSDCADGESFLLDYNAHIPLGDPSGFGGILYGLHLEGSIAAVPVPAAIWLFCSGMIGLIVSVTRNKKQ